MNTASVVAVKYLEPDWAPTEAFLRSLNVPVWFVDRDGVHSLTKAYNAGFRAVLDEDFRPDYVWFVTNVRPCPGVLERLTSRLDNLPGCAAIHPAFASDHEHLRPDGSGQVVEGVPFLEFTCPLVRTAVYERFPLDDRMPYWGHDLDWGYRVRQAGWTMAVDHGVMVGHQYIRNSKPHPVTARRQRLRTLSNEPTRRALTATYGPEWRKVLEYP